MLFPFSLPKSTNSPSGFSPSSISKFGCFVDFISNGLFVDFEAIFGFCIVSVVILMGLGENSSIIEEVVSLLDVIGVGEEEIIVESPVLGVLSSKIFVPKTAVEKNSRVLLSSPTANVVLLPFVFPRPKLTNSPSGFSPPSISRFGCFVDVISNGLFVGFVCSEIVSVVILRGILKDASTDEVVSFFDGIGVDEIIVEDPIEEGEVLMDEEMSSGFVDGSKVD